MSLELVESGFTRPDVQARYERYMREHHGEIEMPNFTETMVNYGERRMAAAMTEFSDILPLMSQIESRVRALRRSLLWVLNEAEDVEQEALPL